MDTPQVLTDVTPKNHKTRTAPSHAWFINLILIVWGVGATIVAYFLFSLMSAMAVNYAEKIEHLEAAISGYETKYGVSMACKRNPMGQLHCFESSVIGDQEQN